MAAALQFLVNGTPHREERVAPTTTVLDYVRETLRLTGTKEGCAEGDCGACTVLIGRPHRQSLEWQPVNSCLMLLPQLDGLALETVEGVGRGSALGPVQQALIEMNATQCGFCTPGFVMAIEALRRSGDAEKGESVDEAIIHDALAGNLCRCTGYRPIVAAARRALAAPVREDVVETSVTERAQALGRCPAYGAGTDVFMMPASIEELVTLREQHPAALLTAGATDIGLIVSKGGDAAQPFISTARIAELRRIHEEPDHLVIGAAATYAEGLPFLDRLFPSFAALVRRIGSRQIRALGTFGGNLGTCSPIGDTLPVLMALDAVVELRSRGGTRRLSMEDFVVGYRATALKPTEFIASVTIPLVRQGEEIVAYKLSKRFDQDIATVIAAFRLRLDGGKVAALRAAYGGMSDRVARATHLERMLIGGAWNLEALDAVEDAISRDFAPMSDHRGSAPYRVRAAAGLVRRLYFETAAGGTPVRLEAL